MADCNSGCYGQDSCDEGFNGQAFDWTTRQSRFWYSDDCGNEISAWYEQAINLLPDNKYGESHDIVPAESYKHFYINGWMEEVTDHALDEDCMHHCSPSYMSETETNCNCNYCDYDDYYRVIPERVDLAVQHAHDHDTQDDHIMLDFQNPDPTAGDDSDNGVGLEDLIIPAANAAASSLHPVAAAGSAATLAWIDNAEFAPSSDTDMEKESISTEENRLIWRIPLSATHQDDMPTSSCDSSSVKFTMTGGGAPYAGKDLRVYCYYRNRYTYRKYTESSTYCSDGSFDCSSVYEYLRTSNPVVQEYNFQLKDF